MKRLFFLLILLAIGFYVAWPAFTGYRIYQGLEGNDPAALEATIDFPSVRQSMRGPVLSQVNTRIETVMKDLGPATGLIGKAIPRDNIEKIIDGALATVVEPAKIADIYARGGDLNAAIKDAVLNEINKMGGLMAVLKLDKLFGSPPDDGDRADGDGDRRIGGFKVPNGLGALLQDKRVNEAIGGVAGKLGLDAEKLADKLFPSRAGLAKERPLGSEGTKASYGIGNIKSFGFADPFAFEVGVARSATADAPEVTTEMAFRNYDWRVTKITPNLLER